MNLREYFRKIREVEASIDESDTVVRSLPTPDGGKPGVLTEVPRSLAAQMIVEGRAERAGKEDCRLFEERKKADQAAAQRAELANKLQVTIVTDGVQPESRSSQRAEMSRK